MIHRAILFSARRTKAIGMGYHEKKFEKSTLFVDAHIAYIASEIFCASARGLFLVIVEG